MQRRHNLIVEVDFDEPIGARQAEEKVLRWLEHFGHTAPSFGFEFFSLGRITTKLMEGHDGDTSST